MKTKYGVWHSMQKRFVFGIQEDTPADAWNKLFKCIGTDAYKWRYEVKRIPRGWKNKPNPYYKKGR